MRCCSWKRESEEHSSPFDELHHDGARVSATFDAVDLGDVRMVQRGEGFGFPLESRQAIRVRGERLRQDLERDVSIELGVARAVHLAHAAGPEGAENLVRAKARPGG